MFHPFGSDHRALRLKRHEKGMIMMFSQWNDDQTIPTDLPLLNRWVGTYAGAKPLAGVTMLLIQHQLGNHVPQTQALLRLGLDPERLFWLDVPYTANRAVHDALVGLGIPSVNFNVSDDYPVLDPYAPYQRRRTQNMLLEFLKEPPERLVVLDDGAYFLEAMACFRRRLPRVAIVEQTTRGMIKMENSAVLQSLAREIPLVNVARSVPKKTLEPPFIGYAVCTTLRRKLGHQFRASREDRCLILGFGAIGRQVAATMREFGFDAAQVFVYDTEDARRQEAHLLGFRIWERTFGVCFRLVIGCSGRNSFTIGDYVFLADGARLVSASSGAVELSREDFIDLAATHDQDDIVVKNRNVRDVHSDLHFQLVDREAIFLNGGFPVNFDGRVNCVPAHYIQPTPTMMVAGAVQAATATKPGPVQLDPDFCTWIDREFRKELGREASILPPS